MHWVKNLGSLVGLALVVHLVTIWVLLPQGAPTADARTPVQVLTDDLLLTVSRVDAQFAQAWAERGLMPAPRGNDLTIMRRLSLGLTGRVPSLEEIRQFETFPEGERVTWWVDHLTADRRFGDHVAERLARAYVGVEDGPFLLYRKRRFLTWLSDELMANRPYDQLVTQLVSERGLWTERPAVNFTTVTINPDGDNNRPDPVKLAGRVSRAFLATRLDCVECHDDFLGGDLKQSDFHELASFFREAENSFVGITDQADAKYLVKYLGDAEEREVPAKVPFRDDLLPEDEGPQRKRLAAWLTHPENAPFARATVNRMWAVMTGRPLVAPVDDIPVSGSFAEGTLPPGLELLAEDFVSHGFDLKRLIRLIAMTAAYQTDSRADHELTPEHERYWASFPVTRLRPEQVVGGVSQSASLTTVDADSHIVTRLVQFGEKTEFLERYGDAGDDEFATHGGTIPQRLLMMNGKLVHERTKNDLVRNGSTRIARLAPDDETAVEITYLCILTRRPDAVELAHFVARRAEQPKADQANWVEDMFWTLINSSEFAWNH